MHNYLAILKRLLIVFSFIIPYYLGRLGKYYNIVDVDSAILYYISGIVIISWFIGVIVLILLTLMLLGWILTGDVKSYVPKSLF